MSNIIQTTTLRSNLSDALDSIENKKQDYLLVARKGKISAALINLDLLEDFLALSSPRFLKSIKKAREQFKKGDYLTHEEVFGEI